MTHKDKVKELVGRSLNSYHTNALQKIDKIEKKNKEHNHKISMLTNELDNDYLTKTEEGSVISLDHSKEGMVYLDELQGNTLVNYCTDGSKEMTLNGDIDVEGISVTTTEGVDNGKVDVICEGNTLVSHKGEQVISSGNAPFQLDKEIVIKEYNTYMALCSTPAVDGEKIYFRLDFTKLSHNDLLNNGFTTSRGTGGYDNIIFTKEQIKEMPNNTRTTISTIRQVKGSEFPDKTEHSYSIGIKTLLQQDEELFRFKVHDYQIINLTRMFGEGNEPSVEWCDKNIPYFEGMKSVGQDDENGHKIEILSQNKNYFTSNNKFEVIGGVSGKNSIPIYEYVKNMIGKSPQKITFKALISTENFVNDNHYGFDISFKYTDGSEQWSNFTRGYGLNGLGENETRRKFVWTINTLGRTISNLTNCSIFTRTSSGKLIFEEIEIILSDDNTETYIPHKSNKKEILMNEPLRKVNDNLKDRFVKIGNKLFIEKNCKAQTLNGSEGWRISDGGTQFICNQHRTDALGATNIPIICDKINVTTHQILDNGEGYGINLSYYLRINLRDCDAKNGATVEQFIQRLQANPVTIIYPLKTPTYEPLEIEPTLNTYNDITHISNNSIIPCNMKIQNSGYNAIIKPSTLYTIALDTNKSGTIGMNLGGVKGTTTNNVLTLTTPATLTDDSLRIYGKGIKGSKVRLLEGDKTNWIPSFFEGMKSSFEDKVQEDGTYKMEILSNNKNILNLNKHDGVTTHTHHGVTFTYNDKTQEFTVNGTATQDLGYQPLLYSKDRFLTFEQGKQYTLSTTTPIPFFVQISEKNVISALTLHPNTMFRNVFDRQNANYCSTKMNYFMIWGINAGDTFNNLKFKLQIEEGSVKTEYISNNYNKIQFSSIEPLRGVNDDIKDRFVFKDNKLMIERNCREVIFNGNTNWSIWSSFEDYNNRKTILFYTSIKGKYTHNCKCDKFYENGAYNTDYEGIKNGGNTNVVWFAIDKIKLNTLDKEGFNAWLRENNVKYCYRLENPTYEEIPFELQKIILEGYENGTLFFDTNIPPTSTVTYAGETPIVKSVKLNKTEVLNNTNDINDNIIPYLMDMDYRVVCLQLESNVEGISMAKLFGGAYEMLKRDIQSNRLSKEEYGYRLADYFNAGKLTEEQVRELEDLR